MLYDLGRNVLGLSRSKELELKQIREIAIVFWLSGLVALVPVLSAGAPNPQEYQPKNVEYKDPESKFMDRWLAVAIEYGLVGLVALWLLRVIIVDVKSDIKLLSQLLMRIAEQSERGGREVEQSIREISTKIDRIARDLERIEYRYNRNQDDNR